MEDSTENSKSEEPMDIDTPAPEEQKGPSEAKDDKTKQMLKAKFSFRVLKFWAEELKLSKQESHRVTMNFMKLFNNRIQSSNLEDLRDSVNMFEL